MLQQDKKNKDESITIYRRCRKFKVHIVFQTRGYLYYNNDIYRSNTFIQS